MVQTILDQATGICRLAHQRHWQHPLLRLNQARLARARLIIAMPSAPPPLFADPPKLPPPGMARLFETLDINLFTAVQVGWPLWKTTGEGGSCPKRLCHDFGLNALQEGARIDFHRGSPNDDHANVECNGQALSTIYENIDNAHCFATIDVPREERQPPQSSAIPFALTTQFPSQIFYWYFIATI